MQWLWNPSFEICNESNINSPFVLLLQRLLRKTHIIIQTIISQHRKPYKNHWYWVSKYSTNTFTNSSVHFEDSWVSLYPPYLWAICLINDTLHKHLKYNGSCNTSKWTSIYSFYQPFKSLNITFALVFKRKDKPSMH